MKKLFFHPRFVPLLILSVLLLNACLPTYGTIAQVPLKATVTVTRAAQRATIWPTLVPLTETPTLLPTVTATVSPTPGPIAKRVLILSIDGLRPDAIDLAPMPNLKALMQIGAYSLTAQTIFPSSTLPSHASMLTGLCPAQHGVDWNDYIPERGYAKGIDLFDLAHAAGLKTVMFVGKEKLKQITEPESVDIFRYINDRDVVLVERLTEEFPTDFGLLFIHFATPDAMGHVYGWLSPEYISVVQRADEALGTILKDLDERGLRQETLVIVTADHGGHDQTHGSRQAEDMTIPWVISGLGVRPGPISSPIQTIDTAATAAWALNLPRPVDWDGWPVFEAFGRILQLRPKPFCE